MRVKILYESTFQVVGIMTGDECPSEKFLKEGEKKTLASRQGLFTVLKHVAENGLTGLPRAWSHEVSKNEAIYEFIKGDLRLFFFHGDGKQIAVCTTGLIKKKQKVDEQAVRKAVTYKNEYFDAVKSNECEVIDDEDE